MAKVTVKMIGSGVRQVLKSAPAQKELSALAARIAKAAGPGFEAVEGDPYWRTARAYVQPVDYEAMKAEAEDKVLTRAFGSARETG